MSEPYTYVHGVYIRFIWHRSEVKTKLNCWEGVDFSYEVLMIETKIVENMKEEVEFVVHDYINEKQWSSTVK